MIQDFIDVRGYPEWITVTRVLDGGETPLFTQYFSDWHDRDETLVPQPNLEEEHSGDNVASEWCYTINSLVSYCFFNLSTMFTVSPSFQPACNHTY